MSEAPPEQTTRREPWIHIPDLALLLLVAAVVMWLRWAKLNTLIREDQGWWLLEGMRFARGEMPYRDFFWQYPPLGVAALGYALRWFGITFDVAQAVINAWSVLILLLAYLWTRFLLPRVLRFAAALLLIAVCSTTLTYFSLFSMMSYAPSLHPMVAGLLLFLIGVFDYLERGKFDLRSVGLSAAGASIAMLGKQEGMLTVAAVWAVLGCVDRRIGFRDKPTAVWLRQYLLLGVVWTLPTLVVMFAMGVLAGWENLKHAMGGYGLATVACPWWPTGLGIFAAVAALGLATFVVAVCSRRRSGRFWILAIAGLLVHLAYHAHLQWPLLTADVSIAEKLRRIVPGLLYTSEVLKPVMWASIVYFFVIAHTLWHHHLDAATFRERAKVLVLLTLPVALCSRSLFSSNLGPTPEVTAIAYPFLLLIGPYLLLRAIGFVPGPVIALVVLYSLVRFAGGYAGAFSDREYGVLETRAGRVKLKEHALNAEIYRYVEEHAGESETILNLPYGGGMNFATHRTTPIFTTLYSQTRMPEMYQQRDLADLRKTPPRLVIAEDDARLGTLWGMPGNMACPCPRLVWIPDCPSYDASVVYPIVPFIQENYRVEKKMGKTLLLTRR